MAKYRKPSAGFVLALHKAEEDKAEDDAGSEYYCDVCATWTKSKTRPYVSDCEVWACGMCVERYGLQCAEIILTGVSK